MAHLLAVFLLAVHTLTTSAYNCPPADRISPCECHLREKWNEIFTMVSLSCDNMDSLASVRTALGSSFRGNVNLTLTRLKANALPSSALGQIVLERLDVRDSDIRRVENGAFDGQHLLQVLRLDYDKMEEIELQELSSLYMLSLSGNSLTRIHDKSVSSLVKLEHLTLSGNQIADIAANAFPGKVKTLAITRNLLSTFNGSLQSLGQLEEVYASNNRFTNIGGEFDGIVRLKKLILDHNQISDISGGFSNVASLEFLNLAGNQIQDVGEALKRLRKLKVLNLARNRITNLQSRVFQHMEYLHYLDLSGNTVTTICPSLLSETLLTLKLSNMTLQSFQDFDCLTDIRNLKSLDLSHNRFSTLRHEIKLNAKLTYVDIRSNSFTSLRSLRLPIINEDPTMLKMGGNTWSCTEKVMLILHEMEGRGYEFQGHPRCHEPVQ